MEQQKQAEQQKQTTPFNPNEAVGEQSEQRQKGNIPADQGDEQSNPTGSNQAPPEEGSAAKIAD